MSKSIPNAHYTDAVFTSLEMSHFIYARLKSSLRELATFYENAKVKSPEYVGAKVPHSSKLSAIVDAWSLVDVHKRLRDLLHQWPGIRKKDWPQIGDYCRRSAGVTELRNCVQHLNNALVQLDETNHRAWGSIAWLARSAYDADNHRSYVLLPGAIRGGNYGLLCVAPSAPTYDLGHIVLSFMNLKINLSYLEEDAAELRNGIQCLLDSLRSSQPSQGFDAVFHAQIEIRPGSPEFKRPK